MLKLMYITNKPAVAQIAEQAGVDWIFLDMEFIGKDARQGGLDTVQNHHTVSDVKNIKAVVKTAKLLVRVNPIHEALSNYPSSKDEIDATIDAGADIVMLPFFKTVAEVESFISFVDSRAKTCLLLETAESATLIDEILKVPGIDMIHIGLNDLHLSLGMKFMFQLLTDGIVESLANKIKAKVIMFGFGGLARLDAGAVPGKYVLKEHYRLGSSMVIISRSFCNTDKVEDLDEVKQIFNKGISEIRGLEKEAEAAAVYFSDNAEALRTAVDKVIKC